MQNYTKKFNELDKTKADIAGGKGASLGEMLNAGIPVPDGFVVLSTTFENFLHKADLIQEIDAILESVDHKAVHSIDGASEKIQELIKHAEMPSDIASEIEEQFKTLDSEFVAVRSSATAEDGADHAWAGQLDSYLNTTKDTLLEKVQHCWASLFTPRAIFYRFEKGLNTTKISVAVVVQKMVNSEKSGIAFSVHPVTEDRNQIIIEAGFGLGEAIVSGSVTPDSYVVEKEPRKIIDINVSNQTRAMYRKAGGGNEWQELGEKGGTQVFTEPEILDLANIIMTIENHYGFPCDIEWAFESGKFYITQSRPITTLSDKTFNKEQKLLASKFIDELGGTKFLPPINNYSLFIFGSGYNTKKYYGAVYKSQPKYTVFNVRYNGLTQAFLAEYPWKQYAVEVFTDYLKDQNIINPIKENFYKNFPKVKEIYDKYTYEYIKTQSEENLTSFIEDNFNMFFTTNAWSHFSIYFDLDICYSVVHSVYPDVLKHDIESIWHNATEMVAESFDKGQKRDILNYLKNNGKDAHLSEHCQYFFTTYKNVQSLENVFTELEKNYGKFLNDSKAVVEELNKMDKELEEKKESFNHWREGLSDMEKNIVDFCQTVMQVRDERKNNFSKQITTAWRVAEKLFDIAHVDKNLIENILPFEELAKGSNYISSIKDELEKRQSGYIVYVPYDNKKEISYDLLAENYEMVNSYFMKESEVNSNEIKGQIGNKGNVQGYVKIVKSVDEFSKFKNDEILVTGMTRPEFVSLMHIAKAIITDEGGITCHAAIVSRELNKPCVIGTKFATKILKDGDFVEVDANNGIIKILNK